MNQTWAWSDFQTHLDSDEGPVLTTWYEDSDGDGYGDPNDSIKAESQPTGIIVILWTIKASIIVNQY
jgi:hypothetical protein